MMEEHTERYFLTDDLVIDVITEAEGDHDLVSGFGLLILGGEEKNEGAEEGSDEEYSHPVKDTICFKDKDNLKMAQMGLELLNTALDNERELEENEQ